MQVRRAVAVGLLICVGLVAPATPAGAQTPEQQMRALREQGIHYHRKKRYGAAADVLERARTLPGGEEDYEVISTLGRVYYDMLIVDRAIPLAERAVELADSEQERGDAQRFVEGLRDRFGGVLLQAPAPPHKGPSSGTIKLEDRGGLIHLKKKQAFEELASRLDTEAVDLPLTVYLPFGRYAANGVEFVVARGAVTKVSVTPTPAGRGLGINPWWYVGGGAVLAAGAAVLVAVLAADEPEDTQALRVDQVHFMNRPLAGAQGE